VTSETVYFPALPSAPFAGDDPDNLGHVDEPEPVDQYLTRAHRRTYTPAERMGYVMLAVMDGDSETCRRHGLPRATLQSWLREVGGLTQVREFLQARAVHDFLEAERSIYALVRRQADAGEIPKEELYQTVRSLIHARALLPAQQQAQPALAAAQATVTVKVEGGEGERVIDLGPAPEE
jgi:transposase-like protein